MLIVGTRPEIVKMAPVLRELQAKFIRFVFVHCGQHYDYNMSQQFIEELELPKPDYGFKVRVSSPSLQTSRIMAIIGKVVSEIKPRLVLVEGDTNGVLAGALAALKMNIPVGHVEAGLRSFDLRMPEEHNRRLVDHISAYLFAPTENARKNLEKENVWGKIFVTGNTVIDAVMQHLPLAEKKSEILKKIGFDEFALATAHRAENVDDSVVLQNLIEAFIEAPIPVVYPVHPRTQKRLRQHGMWKKLVLSKNVQTLPPLGYLDFLLLMKECRLIITDSGGIQEEATASPLRKPVLVTRLSTERPEAVKSGFAKVVGVEKKGILENIKLVLMGKFSFSQLCPYGNGDAAMKIVNVVKETY